MFNSTIIKFEVDKMYNVYEELSKLYEEDILIEMALARRDAIDRCISYGSEFCEHFNIICDEGIYSDDFKHHCGELQGWFKIVCKIKLKDTKKAPSNEDLVDWFFTAGQNIEDVIKKNYISIYEKFVDIMLNNRDDSKLVSDILEDLLE